MEKKFEIPKGAEKPKMTEPRSLIIYGLPKTGKSSVVAQLPGSLIIEHEPEGLDAIEARSIYIDNPFDIEPLLAQLKDDDTVDFIVIDTITKWDEWSEIVGTYDYMKKPQGKNFNVVGGKRLNHKDPRFETVHELGGGFGYRYSRAVMKRWLMAAMKTGKRVIFLAHVKDKFIKDDKTGEVFEISELNLTGAVKSIYAAYTSAIAYLYREGTTGYLSFETMGGVLGGNRFPYLQGKIKISEFNKETHKLTTFWENIYPSLKK